MDLITAARNAAIEMDNIHREYLAGQHGGCPCGEDSEACPLGAALDNLQQALTEASAGQR